MSLEINRPPQEVEMRRDNLQEFLNSLSVSADYELRSTKVIIRVHRNQGTSMYLAKAEEDLFRLRKMATKVEERGIVTAYHIPL